MVSPVCQTSIWYINGSYLYFIFHICHYIYTYILLEPENVEPIDSTSAVALAQVSIELKRRWIRSYKWRWRVGFDCLTETEFSVIILWLDISEEYYNLVVPTGVSPRKTHGRFICLAFNVADPRRLFRLW